MHILTFDIEDWFHILDNPSTQTESEWSRYESRIETNLEVILEVLSAHDLRATFFILGWMAEKYPQIVKRISDMGFEVGSHSRMHQLVYTQDRSAFVSDLEKSIKVLEDLTGKKVRCYRAPGFSVKRGQKWVFEELVTQGIEIDCSIFPARRAHGGFSDFGAAEPARVEINGAFIKEFPINLHRFFGRKWVFSGGGYFRIFPYTLIRRFMQRSEYVITYFHPRDFDARQPVIDELPWQRKFKSYCGLNGALTKFVRLVREFDFIDIATADSLVDWQHTKTITY